jgi:hypothetical protein
MGKWGLLKGVALLSVLLSVSELPVCRSAAGCAPDARTPKVFRVALVPISRAIQEQAPPTASSQTGAHPTHKVKIWTTEELIATRTPADLYIFEKEAQAAALEVEGFKNLASCFAFDRPEGNAEETQKEINATLQSIRDTEDSVAQSRRTLNQGPDNLKLRNQLELAQRMSELNHARERLWSLQEHLRELEKPPAESVAPSQ